ncbi:FHA domain-containing protein, partial [Nakamurella sp. GG22]
RLSPRLPSTTDKHESMPPVAPPPAPAVQPAPQPPPPPDAPAPVLRPPRVSDRIHGSNVHEARRPPLPVAGAKPVAPRPGSPAQPSHVLVKGFRCSRNHHNDPRVSFCSVCGIRMDQRTGILVDGRRPPLGLLVLDIGATFVLDDNYLIGRNPEVDEAVIRSRLRPIRLDDDSGTLSRVHAEIRLEGWDVLLLDRGSANGTHIAGAGQSGWTRLAPQQPVVLAPGMHVRVGRRMFTFESAHARI